MGNRAYVQFINADDEGAAVYLHWNGGLESIVAFLAECERRGARVGDLEYGTAQFVRVVGDFFGGTLSLGVNRNAFDPGDNGIYRINVANRTIDRSRAQLNAAYNDKYWEALGDWFDKWATATMAVRQALGAEIYEHVYPPRKPLEECERWRPSIKAMADAIERT